MASHRLRRGLPARAVLQVLPAHHRGQQQDRVSLLLRLEVDFLGTRSPGRRVRQEQAPGGADHLGRHASDDADADGSEFGHRRPCRADDMGLRRRH